MRDEILGVNSLADLAQAREIMQERILLEHLGNGVIITIRRPRGSTTA
jgi:bifunctional N-acetylglucosamine-1-phosphate-uridyltransferase/glucosamine-1-phosphate-acetyltransferase GlmU-like protein